MLTLQLKFELANQCADAIWKILNFKYLPVKNIRIHVYVVFLVHAYLTLKLFKQLENNDFDYWSQFEILVFSRTLLNHTGTKFQNATS